MNKFSFVLLTVLVGCGVSEEKFKSESISISCEKMVECAPEMGEYLGFSDQASCEEVFNEAVAEDESTCTYDASKAQACLDEMSATTCEQFTSGEETASSCDSVCE